MAIDYGKLLTDYPNINQEYQQEATRDKKSINNLQAIGATSPERYAEWWWNNLADPGFKGTYGADNAAKPPVPVDPTTPTGPATGGTGVNAGGPLVGNPLDPLPGQGTGTGTDVNSVDTKDPLVNLTNSIGNLINGLMKQQTTAQAQSQAREGARNSVYSLFGTAGQKIPSSLLDQQINDILNSKYTEASHVLDTGKARGQYNDVGYNAGLGALDKSRDAIKSRLTTTGEGVLGGYRSQYNDLLDQALGQANTFSGNGSFDTSPFQGQITDLLGRISSTAPGALQESVGNDPLFDLSAIRGDVAKAQGSMNLRDMSLTDALAKRKKVDSLGRGIGSQGSF